MDIDENLHRPAESGSADVTLLARGITVTVSVEESSTGLVVVRPCPTRPQGEIQAGDRVELYWIGGHEERTLGGEVSSIDDGPEPRWRIAVSGMAERSQRRKAVRAQVSVDVLIPWAGGQMTGHTVDLSEGGMRALMDGWGLPPEPGTSTQVSLTTDDTLLHLRGSVVWTSIRGAQWLLAMQFLDVPEDAGDRLRRRVFQALRDERAAAAR